MTNSDIDIDFRSIIWEDGFAVWVTGWQNNIPKWYRVTYDSDGAYITTEDNKKDYILVDEG